jgi:hypothetical protein
LTELSPRFDALYAAGGRPSIPPEQLLSPPGTPRTDRWQIAGAVKEPPTALHAPGHTNLSGPSRIAGSVRRLNLVNAASLPLRGTLRAGRQETITSAAERVTPALRKEVAVSRPLQFH